MLNELGSIMNEEIVKEQSLSSIRTESKGSNINFKRTRLSPTKSMNLSV